jgi:FlaA1/EpsC-like NDP-sugar epimerase
VLKNKKTSKLFFSKKLNIFLEDIFSNLGYLPRWIIFCIDICIVFFASIVTYFIVTSLTFVHYDTYSVFLRYFINIIVYIFFFYSFKTYAGIIRHSSFIDASKLLLATFSSFSALVILNYAHYFLVGTKIFLFPVLVIHFIISFLTLFLFRIVVRFVYEKYIEIGNEDNFQRILIFGTDTNALAIAKALTLEKPRKYKVVAFIAENKSKENKELLGLPILNKKEKISDSLKTLNANALIITGNSLSKKQQIKIVDDCLDHNFQVLTLEKVKDWNDQEEITKNLKSFDINDLLERKPIKLNSTQISAQIKNKVVLISGAAGSIGSEIVLQIINFRPKTIILVDQAETPLYNIVSLFESNSFEVNIIPFVADIKDEIFLNYIFKAYKPQVVYHAAAYKHVPLMEENPYQAVFTNVLGTKNIADISLKNNVESFVMVSTDKAVNPSSIMGASKRIAEQYIQSLALEVKGNKECRTKFITTRFGNVLGSNGSVVPLFTKQIQEGGPVTLTHPDIIRYFMTIPEACQLVLEAGTMGNGGEIYIFDMGKPVKIIDLATKMIKLAGFIPEKDIEIKIIGLRPGEKLYEELLNNTSKTLATHHDKIMIAIEEHTFSNEVMNLNVQKLITLANELNMIEIVKEMKQMVPEFKSLNSTFQMLDN